MLKQSAATRSRQRPDAQPRPAPIHAKAFLFSFLCRWWCGRTDGRQCHRMPPTPGSRAVEPAAAADQRRGTARHGTTSRSRVHRESPLSLSLHVSSWHCRARPGFSWYGDWHASAWPVPVVCTWAHINSVPNMDGEARPLLYTLLSPHATCMPGAALSSCPPSKGPVVQSNTFFPFNL